eukprot:Phypoly_transcript_02053.p1 GENE.Phypoly_transcript_02053~~Phypoly_transcript_02053.p1  ORF type:complete len:900 (+),score=110.07 Phypoly_transcript_02053:31-2730(+)
MFCVTLLCAVAFFLIPSYAFTFESSTQVVKNWDFIGPFTIGKGEVDGDSLEAFGGIKEVEKNRKKGGKGEKKKEFFYSEIAEGGKVGWRSFVANKDGMVTIEFPDINWNRLVQLTSSVTITEFQGWAVSEVFTHEGRYLASCNGIHTFQIDDTTYVGDQYSTGNVHAVVHLEEDTHIFRVRVRAKGKGIFGCKLEIIDDSKGPLRVYAPVKPDLVDGQLFSEYVGIPVQNVGPSFVGVEFTIRGSDDVIRLHPEHVNPPFKLASGQTTLLPLQIAMNKRNSQGACEGLKFQVEISPKTPERKPVAIDVELRCRTSDQSFIFTFLDFDHTVSYAAAVAPPNKECDATANCPILVSMHGTGVPAQDQADSFKRMEKSKWIFGVEHTWVLAPTRHGAHNWEGVGSKTISSSIDALHHFSLKFSSDRESQTIADPDRLIITGHSMGGHGAWHFSTHNPDRALCVSAQAGWIKKEYYGDSNVLFDHDIADSYTDAIMRGLIESSITENDVDLIASNLKGIPILARIGADDTSVPPWQMRRMVRLLAEAGSNITYTELPGKGHWWWDSDKTNDGGVMNDAEMRKFYKKCAKKVELPELPSKISIKTVNPASMGSRAGIKILQLEIPYRLGRLDLNIEHGVWQLSTSNVRQIAFEKPARLRWPDMATVKIDGQVFGEGGLLKELLAVGKVCKKEGTWSTCNSGAHSRSPETYGPARQVTEGPFSIVIGTKGSESEVKDLHDIGLYLANSHYMAHGTYAPVLIDKDMHLDTPFGRNLILIGGPNHNSATERLAKKERVVPGVGSNFKIGNCNLSGPGRGAIYLGPWDDQGHTRLFLVIEGSDADGLKDIIKVGTPTIPPMTRGPFMNMVSDWLVTGPEFAWKGVGGYLGLGYWGNDWEWRSDTSYCQ